MENREERTSLWNKWEALAVKVEDFKYIFQNEVTYSKKYIIEERNNIDDIIMAILRLKEETTEYMKERLNDIE